MKIIKNKFFICILLLLMSVDGYSGASGPNQPSVNQTADLDCGVDENGDPIPCPDPDPGDGPIDENLALLALSGALFGIFVMYKNNQNKKRPV